MERGDDDASWPIPPEVPVQVQGLGVAIGKNRPVISGGFRRSGLSGLLQSVSNEFKSIYFFIFRKQGQGKGFTFCWDILRRHLPRCALDGSHIGTGGDNGIRQWYKGTIGYPSISQFVLFCIVLPLLFLLGLVYFVSMWL